jgi:CubicO group peptidase (beta-lactamase class C family)
MKDFRLALIMISFSALFAGCSSSGTNDSAPVDYRQVIDEVRAYIDEGMTANMVTGAAIALVDDGQIVWTEGFGYSDKENTVAARPDTIFEIGSISKTLTTMAVMRLVDAGKLDIDKPLETIIPEFTINQRFTSLPITVRSMLTHHSGLPTDIFIGGFTANSPDLLWVDWLLGYIKDEYTANPVGYSGAYSNTAFALLHKVIENASGQPFFSYTDAMFDTMGMCDTTFGSRALPPERISKGYYIGDPQVYLYANISTAGAVRSTVIDMARYIRTILLAGGGTLLKPETMNEVFSVQSTGSLADSTTKHGLCFFLNDEKLDYAGRLAWHNGATVDQTSHMEILLDHGLGVIMLTNSITGSEFSGDVTRKTLQLALEAKKGIKPSSPPNPPDSPSAAPPAGLIDSIVGIYPGEASPVFISDNNALGIKMVMGELEFQLSYLENGRWKASGRISQFEFRKVGQDTLLFYWETAVDSQRLGKLFRPPAISAAWRARLGDWEIVNLPDSDEANFVSQDIALVKKTLSFRIENGALLMDGPLRKGMVLDPVNDTLAFTAGIGRNRGESVRILDEDSREIVLMSGAKYIKN